jgi:hypothetical protein
MYSSGAHYVEEKRQQKKTLVVTLIIKMIYSFLLPLHADVGDFFMLIHI